VRSYALSVFSEASTPPSSAGSPLLAIAGSGAHAAVPAGWFKYGRMELQWLSPLDCLERVGAGAGTCCKVAQGAASREIACDAAAAAKEASLLSADEDWCSSGGTTFSGIDVAASSGGCDGRSDSERMAGSVWRRGEAAAAPRASDDRAHGTAAVKSLTGTAPTLLMLSCRCFARGGGDRSGMLAA